MTKIVTLWNQDVSLQRTDWKFRRSTGSSTDVDIDWKPVPPGHMILFKEDGGGITTSQARLEYISRTEAFGTLTRLPGGKITRPFYMVDDDTVWQGTFIVKLADGEQ